MKMKEIAETVKKVIQLIYDKSAGHPYFVAFFAHDLLEYKQHGRIDIRFFNSVFNKIFPHLAAARFVKDIEVASEKEIRILKKLSDAKSASPKEIRNISDSGAYFKRLVDKNLIIKKGRGEYSLYHPLFGEYLKEYITRKKQKQQN